MVEMNESSPFTRRRFLLAAGVGAVVVGSPALLAACSSGGDPSSEGAEGSSGSGSEGVIKIGYVTPRTGALASFGEPDSWTISKMREQFGNGLELDGVTYTVEIIERDSESNSNTAASVAQELIVEEGIDLMLVSSTPDTTIPVVQQCTNNEIPCLSNNAPWQPHYTGIGGELGDGEPPLASKWNFHYFFGLEDVIEVFIDMWSSVAPGGVVGVMYPDDPDGNAWGDPVVGFPPALEAAGFTVVDPGRFPLGGNDFTSQINLFKSEGVDILTGNLPAPEFGNFWAQAQQQGLSAKAVTFGKSLLFPGAVESFDNPAGLSTEMWWSDKHPTSSSLTGQTSEELAREYEEETSTQWTQPLGYAHSIFEVAIDAIVRAGGVSDKEALLTALGETNLDTMAGNVNWANSVVPQVTKTPLIAGQWAEGEEWGYELQVRSNVQLPEIEVDGPMESL